MTPTEFLHAGNDPSGAHNDHVHVAYNKGNVGPLLEEMRYKPPGSSLAVVNSSETVLNGDQTQMLAKAIGKSGHSINIGTINVSGDNAKDIANDVAAEILNALTQIEQSTIA